MNRKKFVSPAATAIIGLGALVTAGAAQAINFGDMMNPGRWFGGDRDRYDRYDRYGWGGPYGYGGPHGGWGSPYGYGGPWGSGYGPGWGGGYPGYGPGSTIVVTPQGGRSEQGPPPPRLPE